MSNDELGLVEDKLAQPSEEVVHEATHSYYFQARTAVPHLMLHLCHVQNTPHVP